MDDEYVREPFVVLLPMVVPALQFGRSAAWHKEHQPREGRDARIALDVGGARRGAHGDLQERVNALSLRGVFHGHCDKLEFDALSKLPMFFLRLLRYAGSSKHTLPSESFMGLSHTSSP